MPKMKPQPLKNVRVSVVASDWNPEIGRISGTNPAREAAKRQEAQIVAESKGCEINRFSSRVCEQGTQGCEVRHIKVPVSEAQDKALGPANYVAQCSKDGSWIAWWGNPIKFEELQEVTDECYPNGGGFYPPVDNVKPFLENEVWYWINK